MTQHTPGYDPAVELYQKNKNHKSNPSKVWYVQYYLPNGVRLNFSTKQTVKGEARKEAKAKEEALLKGKFTARELERLGPVYATARPVGSEYTIEEALERYFALTAPDKGPKTLEREKCDLRRYFRYLAGELGDDGKAVDDAELPRLVYLHEISTARVNDLLAKRYGKAAPATRLGVRVAVRKVFRLLIGEGSFKHPNPVDGAIKVKASPDQRRRSVWIPWVHYKRLIDAAPAVKTPIQNFPEMMALQWEVAFRRDEMLTLEWDQVDLSKGEIEIRVKDNFPTRLGPGWAPKWRKERTVILSQRAVEILRSIPRRQTFAFLGPVKNGDLKPVNIVFPRRYRHEGNRIYVRANEFKNAWATMKEHAGLADEDYAWHDVRRSWNRYAAERGVPTSYRADFLGHEEEVNSGNYGTEMGKEFVREKLGFSMAESAADSDSTVRDLFEKPMKRKVK